MLICCKAGNVTGGVALNEADSVSVCTLHFVLQYVHVWMGLFALFVHSCDMHLSTIAVFNSL